MSLRRRVRTAEEQMGFGLRLVHPIFMAGRDDLNAKEQARAVLAAGGLVRIIRYELSLQADSIEEAEELIASHRADDHDQCGVEVHRRGGNDLLAAWHPEPPAWLQALRDEDQG